jgi:hypothetical protein
MTSGARRLRILLLCDNVRDTASTIFDHIRAFTDLSRHRVVVLNPRPFRHLFSIDLDHFDVVILHYTICILFETYLPASFKKRLRRYRGLKIQFIQDDYRSVDQFARLISELGIHVLFTLAAPSVIPRLWERYPELRSVDIHSTLAGYVPESFLTVHVPKPGDRPVDVSYRGRTLPYSIGALGQQKVEIGKRFLELAKPYKLRCDIAWGEPDRIYGKEWVRFLASTKAVLGTESGASITDFDGSVEGRVNLYLSEHPGADFEAVTRDVLGPFEGNLVINVISPRMFEAIALRTALVLFPGEYGGILRPWDHYIPLEEDFSNLPTVVQKIRDAAFLEELVEHSHQEIVKSGQYSYRRFMAEVDEIITHAYERLGDGRHRMAGSADRLRTSTVPMLREELGWYVVRALLTVARLIDSRRPYFPLLRRAGLRVRTVVRLVRLGWKKPKAVLWNFLMLALCLRDRATRRFLMRVFRGRQGMNRIECVPAVAMVGGMAVLRNAAGRKSETDGQLCIRVDPGHSWIEVRSVLIGGSPPQRCATRAEIASALGSGKVTRIRWTNEAYPASPLGRLLPKQLECATPTEFVRCYSDTLAELLGAHEEPASPLEISRVTG